MDASSPRWSWVHTRLYCTPSRAGSLRLCGQKVDPERGSEEWVLGKENLAGWDVGVSGREGGGEERLSRVRQAPTPTPTRRGEPRCAGRRRPNGHGTGSRVGSPGQVPGKHFHPVHRTVPRRTQTQPSRPSSPRPPSRAAEGSGIGKPV